MILKVQRSETEKAVCSFEISTHELPGSIQVAVRALLRTLVDAKDGEVVTLAVTKEAGDLPIPVVRIPGQPHAQPTQPQPVQP